MNIRWLTATDPVFFESLNRPHADAVLRQLILAKAVDTLQLGLGRQVLFPFLVQPLVVSGTTTVNVPPNWIWDVSMSLPKKWQDLRLAKIKRIAGTNTATAYTGSLRLIFTATQELSSTELAVFYADYQIDSALTYQLSRLSVATTTEEALSIDTTEKNTVAGFIEFRTLDTLDTIVQTFLNLLDPPVDTSSTNDYYNTPSVYEIVDSEAGGTDVTGDFQATVVSHGTGLLLDSAWNAIPDLESDINGWLGAFNYPFDAAATRTSADNVIIPKTLFREFDIVAPAGDEPTGATAGTYFPVWVSRIELTAAGSDILKWYFATHNVTDTETGGVPSQQAVEFATLTIPKSSSSGSIIDIIPSDDLMLSTVDEFQQHFGRGHVVLSSIWTGTSGIIDSFYSAFDSIVDSPIDTTFSVGSTRLSSFAVSRVPKYVPTIGQSRALEGSTSRLTSPIYPSDANRYVNESDQGLGNQIDLESQTGITSHAAIDRYGHSGSLCHKTIKLVVDGTQLPESDATFYATEVLPRLKVLLGRDPQFGDFWFNGTRLMFFNGDTWMG